jgi:hypothetical protein
LCLAFQVVAPVIQQMEKERQKAPLVWQNQDAPAVKELQRKAKVRQAPVFDAIAVVNAVVTAHHSSQPFILAHHPH